jgi:hypothetical protein
MRPRASVGVQARVGLDAYVAGDVRPLALDEHGRLDLDGWTTPEPPGAPARLGRGHLGVETRIA